MTPGLQALLAELERFGAENDAVHAERPRRMLNITRDTGEFLGVLVRALGARQIVEIGTSNGYSTLWLAEAARATGGLVTTVEHAEYKRSMALANFARTGLADAIRSLHADAAAVLRDLPDATVDLLFLDSERSDYPRWWPDLRRVIRPGGLLVVDNAVSHAREMAPFEALVRAAPDWTTSLVPVGNGELLAVRGARAA